MFIVLGFGASEHPGVTSGPVRPMMAGASQKETRPSPSLPAKDERVSGVPDESTL